MKALAFFVMFIVAFPVFANNREMKNLVQVTDGAIWNLPAGYKSVKINSITVRGGLKTFIEQTTKEKVISWGKYVRTSGEFDHVNAAGKRRIAANPLAELEVTALLEVSEVHAIYKGSKLIGYLIEITDHVQAAIYQDGAWYDAFFDTQLNLIEAFDRSA